MSYNNLRKGRIFIPGQIYLVTTVTHHRTPCLADFTLAQQVARTLHTLGLSLAWVIMPDHLHWLLQLPQDMSLPDLVKLLKGRSAHAINKIRQQDGPCWQHSYHDHALRRDEDILTTARYLIANPIRANIVSRVGDYPFWDAVWGDNLGRRA